MRAFAPILLLALAGCQTYAEQQAEGGAHASAFSYDTPESRLSFVQAACGDCHAVQPPALSPNPASPPFADIANRPGISDASLASWLRDAHNYPEVMDFDLDPEQAEAVATYMLTLRRSDYVQPKS